MRALFIFLIFFSSIPVYADCNCAGDVYLHIVYEDKSGVSHDVRAFGGDWSVSQTKNSTPNEKLSSQLENGARLQIVNAFKTHPIKIPNNGTVRIPFVVHSGKEIDKSSVKNIKSVEVISAGCNAYPSPVRQVNQSILTDTKPAKVEEENNKQFGGATYRVFFKKQGKLIWLRYFPEKTGRCMPSSQTEEAVDYKKIFSGDNWATSMPFLAWATPLNNLKTLSAQCSEESRKKLSHSGEEILYCEKIASIGESPKNSAAEIVFSIRKPTAPLESGHDCQIGMTFIGKKKIVYGEDPADCEYVQNIPNPAGKPVVVFRVNKTGNLGIVFDGHGAECGGRAVLLQQEHHFEWVHRLYWRCMG